MDGNDNTKGQDNTVSSGQKKRKKFNRKKVAKIMASVRSGVVAKAYPRIAFILDSEINRQVFACRQSFKDRTILPPGTRVRFRIILNPLNGASAMASDIEPVSQGAQS